MESHNDVLLFNFFRTFHKFIYNLVAMYKLDIPLDAKEAAAIKRRQHLEKERQNRIFNAKNRLIGVRYFL